MVLVSTHEQGFISKFGPPACHGCGLSHSLNVIFTCTFGVRKRLSRLAFPALEARAGILDPRPLYGISLGDSPHSRRHLMMEAPLSNAWLVAQQSSLLVALLVLESCTTRSARFRGPMSPLCVVFSFHPSPHYAANHSNFSRHCPVLEIIVW